MEYNGVDYKVPAEMWGQIFTTMDPQDVLKPTAQSSSRMHTLGMAHLAQKLNKVPLAELFETENPRDHFFRVLRASPATASIERLDFSGIQGDLPLYFARITPNLQQFIYKGPALSSETLSALQKAAEENKLANLVSLELSFDQRVEDSPSPFEAATAVVERTNLSHLILRNTLLGCAFFPFPKEATCLILNNVDMNWEGIQNLLSMPYPNLKYLDLSENPQIDALGVSLLLHTNCLDNLEILKLQHLDLNSDTGLELIRSTFQNIPCLPKLRKLDLRQTFVSLKQQLYLISVFKELSSLNMLLLSFRFDVTMRTVENGLLSLDDVAIQNEIFAVNNDPAVDDPV